MTGLDLRDYQLEALDAASAAWAGGLTRPAVVLPTGMGKTVIFAELIKRYADVDGRLTGRKPMVLVHRDELVNQAVRKINSAAPDLSVGIVKAAKREIEADVIVASVQTLARPRRRAEIPYDVIGLLIVDECHHAAADSYRAIMRYFGCFETTEFNGVGMEVTVPPSTRAIGFTATLTREDNRGLGDVWQCVAYTKDILWGIERNYLVDVRGERILCDELDLATVARRAGELEAGSLGDAMLAAGVGEKIVEAWQEHASDRPTVLFAPTVATAEAFALDFARAGISAAVITGSTELEDRELIYKRYRLGEIKVISNCMVLTEGWDAPWASCAIIARPTGSAGLYVQMVGRVLRPWPGKTDALVLDVVGVSSRIPLATMADLSETHIVPEAGESLHQAKCRLETVAVGSSTKVAGVLSAEQVDLFHRSASVWLYTYRGRPFIPTRSYLFLLHEDPDGTYRVGRCPLRTTRGGEWLLRGIPDLSYAMAWAEKAAKEVDASVSSRSAAWRQGNRSPSPQQVAFAASLGLDVEGKSKVVLSDMLSVHLASRLLDPKGK